MTHKQGKGKSEGEKKKDYGVSTRVLNCTLLWSPVDKKVRHNWCSPLINFKTGDYPKKKKLQEIPMSGTHPNIISPR